MKVCKKTQGVTLIEMLLVMLLASTIIFFGINTIQRYRAEQEFNQIKFNIEVLFQALRQYYQANCGKQGGPLDPVTNPKVIDQPFLIDLRSHLQGYLATNWPNYNAQVDDQDKKLYKGYGAQLNPKVRDNARSIRTCIKDSSGLPVCSFTSLENNNVKSLIWQFQAVVKINDPDNAQRYRAMAGADCVVDSVPDDAPVNCTTDASTTGQYLVWQRAPSYAPMSIGSELWITTPRVKQFNLQYTHDPMYDLSNPDSSTVKYYLCGG